MTADVSALLSGGPADLDELLCGHPGDPAANRVREQLTFQQVNGYLDTAGGMAMTGLHGSRAQAAAALGEQYRADLAWRRAQAEQKAEQHPDRYAATSDAMRDIPDPKGGSGAWLTGSTDDVVAQLRRADPAWRWRNLGYEDTDTDTHAIAARPGHQGYEPADTRAPWARE